MTNDICGIEVRRRSATRARCTERFRGLKPTATGTAPLRGAPQIAHRTSGLGLDERPYGTSRVESRSDDLSVAADFSPRRKNGNISRVAKRRLTC